MSVWTLIAPWVFLFFSLIVPSLGKEHVTPLPTVSPVSEFLAIPKNVTVLEGHPAVLRCKTKDVVHNCQWFYLKFGLDMFDSGSKPVLVKEFRPTKNKDCSIKFSKTRMIQAGQWICKGLQIHARKYVVSRPAFLQVISIEGGSTVQDQSEPEDPEENTDDLSKDITFHLSDEGHLINTKLGEEAMLGCHTNKELKSCSWIRPDGTTARFHDGLNANYVLQGNYTHGNCSLKINEVSARDEGNWRCVVSFANMSGDKLGPLIHLHVLEFGAHANGVQGLSGEKEKDSSLIIILVVTSVVLLVIIVVLVCYMYKHIWRRNSPPHMHLKSSKSGNIDYSNYSSTWLPGIGAKDQKLIDESTEAQPNSGVKPNQYTRYLDMSGNGKAEGYIMFPASSIRSSMSSRTTLSTIPVGHNALANSDNSTRTSTNESLHSVSTFGNPSFERESPSGRELLRRTDSVYSSGHLYEEIDEIKKARENQFPNYANIEEDQEGYVIPKTCSPNTTTTGEEGGDKELPTATPLQSEYPEKTEEPVKAPPYSKVGENGLVPDSDASNFASNPTYSVEEESGNPEESYNVPNDPPVPLRTDSADNPLAQYDVPKKSSEETPPVFV